MRKPILSRLAEVFGVAALVMFLTRAMIPVPDASIILPPGRVYRIPSGHIAIEWNWPRASSVVVTTSTSWAAAGLTYAEGVATSRASGVPASPDYRVLLVSWRLLIGLPLAFFLTCAAGLLYERLALRRRER